VNNESDCNSYVK